MKIVRRIAAILLLAVALVPAVGFSAQADASESKPAQVKSVSVKATGASSVKVSWKVVKGAKGYKVAYSAKKSMAGAKTVTVKGAKKNAVTVKGLKAGKVYYFKVRAYKSVKVLGKWSVVKSAKTRAAHSHSWSAATCTTAKKCACGATEGTALGHSYGAFKVTTPATCTTAGVKTATCTRCSARKTASVAALGHTEVVDPSVDATCTEPGMTEGKRCSVCDEVLLAQTVVPSKGHEFKNGICDRCGMQDPESNLFPDVPLLEYKPLGDYLWARQGDGSIVSTNNGVHDSECRFALIAKEGCTVTIDFAVSSEQYDCLVMRRNEEEVASFNGSDQGTFTQVLSLEDTLEISYCKDGDTSKGDDCAWIKNVTATCTNHDFAITAVDPTCTEEGCTTYACERCFYTMTEPSDPLGHKWVLDEEASYAATCNDDGENKYTCSRCCETKTDRLGALGHAPTIDGQCDRCSTAIPVEVGNYVFFGSYEQDNNTSNGEEPIEWLVLDVRDGKALLLSRYALDRLSFNDVAGETSWAYCSLRTWLNGDFMSEAFNEDEVSRVLKSKLGTDGVTTDDCVFLLSDTEKSKYLESQNSAQCTATSYARSKGAKQWNGTQNYYIDGVGTTTWWLRSRGASGPSFAMYVSCAGTAMQNGMSALDTSPSDAAAVRPAIWVDLS